MLVEYVGYTPKRVNACSGLYGGLASEPIQPIQFSTSIIANDLEDDECSMKFDAMPGFLIFLLNRSLRLMHHALCYALLLTTMMAFSPLL
jgi:hypothetical protein